MEQHRCPLRPLCPVNKHSLGHRHHRMTLDNHRWGDTLRHKAGTPFHQDRLKREREREREKDDKRHRSACMNKPVKYVIKH